MIEYFRLPETLQNYSILFLSLLILLFFLPRLWYLLSGKRSTLPNIKTLQYWYFLKDKWAKTASKLWNYSHEEQIPFFGNFAVCIAFFLVCFNAIFLVQVFELFIPDSYIINLGVFGKHGLLASIATVIFIAAQVLFGHLSYQASLDSSGRILFTRNPQAFKFQFLLYSYPHWVCHSAPVVPGRRC